MIILQVVGLGLALFICYMVCIVAHELALESHSITLKTVALMFSMSAMIAGGYIGLEIWRLIQ